MAAAVLEGSALISIAGKAVQSHQQAIDLLVKEKDRPASELKGRRFEVVVREPSALTPPQIVQSL